jgi:hypothetical protein
MTDATALVVHRYAHDLMPRVLRPIPSSSLLLSMISMSPRTWTTPIAVSGAVLCCWVRQLTNNAEPAIYRRGERTSTRSPLSHMVATTMHTALVFSAMSLSVTPV